MKRSRRLFVGIVAMLIAAGCASDEEPFAEDDEEIAIAIEGPISGSQSSNGIDMRNGAKLAVDEANAEGGVLNKTIRLLEADDKADAERGLSVAREMIEQDVFAVIGPYNSSVGVKNLPLYIDAGVVPIHLTSNQTTDGMGFTVQPKDYQVAPFEADVLAEYLDYKSVGIVYDTSTYTAGIARQLRRELTAKNVDVPMYTKIEGGDRNFEDVVKKVSKNKPDVLYVGTYHPEAAEIIKQADEAGVRADCFLNGLASQDPALVEAAGVRIASKCRSSGVPSAEQFPAAAQYVESYREAYDRDPGTWGSFTFDSVNLLLDAVKQAGGWDAERVTRELSKTKDFTGITGPITIDPKTGNRSNVPIVVLDIDSKGKYVVDPEWAKVSGFGQEAGEE